MCGLEEKQTEGKHHLDEGVLLSFLGCPRHVFDRLHRLHFSQIDEALIVGVLHCVIVPHLTNKISMNTLIMFL